MVVKPHGKNENSFEPPGGRVLRYLALGDSYTVGESVHKDENYPNQTIRILRNQGLLFLPPTVLAVTGWTTGNLIEAIKGCTWFDHVFDVVSLLIGVNNQYQGRSLSEYEVDFSELLNLSITLAGNRPGHVMVLSIPDYSMTPFGGGVADPLRVSSLIDSFNAVNRHLAADYQTHYLDITEESRRAGDDPRLVAVDGLHYSGMEYGIWAVRLAEEIRGILVNIS
jgi:hypothetical protein